MHESTDVIRPRGNTGNLFVICMRQVTKGHLYHNVRMLPFSMGKICIILV